MIHLLTATGHRSVQVKDHHQNGYAPIGLRRMKTSLCLTYEVKNICLALIECLWSWLAILQLTKQHKRLK